MRKLVKSLLAVVLLFALVLAGGETADGGICLPWTLGWLAVVAACGWALNRIENCSTK